DANTVLRVATIEEMPQAKRKLAFSQGSSCQKESGPTKAGQPTAPEMPTDQVTWDLDIMISSVSRKRQL
ncbi:hypothetical protein PanWU01x14_283110, partial [Parasponia andersonii]